MGPSTKEKQNVKTGARGLMAVPAVGRTKKGTNVNGCPVKSVDGKKETEKRTEANSRVGGRKYFFKTKPERKLEKR